MWRGVVFLLLVTAFQDVQAETSSLAFSRNARTFENQHSTLTMKGLANACLSMMIIPDGMPCNPAMTSFATKASLGVEAQLSNGYSSLENVRKILDGKFNQELVDTLFGTGKIIQVEATVDINFHSKYLSGRYSPMSVKGFSVVRNEANPDVDFYSMEESGFTFQSGMETLENLYLGLQVRALKRKFIKQRFKLVALGTQAGQDLLKPKEQSVTFAEPSATYFFSLPWKPRISLMVANLGTVSQKYDELPEPVEAQAGIGFSPPVGWGDLDVNLDYRSLSYEERGLQKLHLGVLYHFGSMYLSSGLDSNGVSAGVFYGLDKINAGIVFSTTQGFAQEAKNYTQTVYAQLGWQI